VIAQQFAADGAESLLHGGKLDEDVGAVPLTVDHPLQAAHLTLDAPQPIEVARLDIGIDRKRETALTRVRSTPAAGMNLSGRSTLPSCHGHHGASNRITRSAPS
jgi:hypothetical protein